MIDSPEYDDGLKPVGEGESADDSIIDNRALREWLYEGRVLRLTDEQDYAYTWATSFVDKEEFLERFTLLAEAMSGESIDEPKKLQAYAVLMNRLEAGLYYPDWWTPKEQEENKGKFNKWTLEWCEKYCSDSYHPAVTHFCESAKKMLTNLSEYSSRSFEYWEWRGSEEEMKKFNAWFPLYAEHRRTL